MQLMLQCRDEVFLELTPVQKKSFTYTELGRKAFEKIKINGYNLGSVGKWAVDLSVLGCNLGVCAGYMIFIASNLRVSYNYFTCTNHYPTICPTILSYCSNIYTVPTAQEIWQ